MESKDILKSLREKNGLTQEALAERLMVTRQAVSRWENGETQPNTETLKLLSKEFGVSINTLLGSPRRAVRLRVEGRAARFPDRAYDGPGEHARGRAAGDVRRVSVAAEALEMRRTRTGTNGRYFRIHVKKQPFSKKGCFFQVQRRRFFTLSPHSPGTAESKRNAASPRRSTRTSRRPCPPPRGNRYP